MFSNTVISSHDDESKTLRVLLEEDLNEEVDCESDTEFVETNSSPFVIITNKDATRRETNPLLSKRVAADMLISSRRTPD